MKHQNVRWKQILGGIFIALALAIWALLFLDHQPKLKNLQGYVPYLKLFEVKAASLLDTVVKVFNWPSIILLFTGIAWFWNAKKMVGVWSYRIVMVYCFAFSGLFFSLLFIANSLVQLPFSRQWQVIAVAFIFLFAGILYYWRSRVLLAQSKQTERAEEKAETAVGETPQIVPQRVVRKAPSSFASCNILQLGGDRHLWHFESRSGQLVLQREQAIVSGQPLPSQLVAKNWRTLWQKKMNIGWLPPEKVFLRALQLPKTDFDETLSMVEFQLEKISPLPVAQIAWSVHVLPQPSAPAAEGQSEAPKTQTIIVTIISRSLVEEFLGALEQEGFLADRLEVPILDKLATTPVHGDGAWVYPDTANQNSALVAWWYGGGLQNVGLVQAAPGEQRSESLREQLTQMAWAGELEGWMTSPPRWHLVADAVQATEWHPALQQALDQPVDVIAPQSSQALASATARRAAHADPNSNLLPQEHALRYQQQFVDRLWMRGVGAVLGAYVVGVLIYFIALQVLTYRTEGVERDVKNLSQSYSNAIRTKQTYDILKEREELKFAPLECWKAVAEHLPADATLQTFDFIDGRRLTLRGTAPADKVKEMLDFNSEIEKVTATDGQLLFIKVESLGYQKDPGGNTISWNFSCELKHTDKQ